MTTRPPNIGYLDNCLVSGIAKQDLSEHEQKALRELLRLRKEGRVELVTSHVTREEIERLPEEVRGRYEDIYALLSDVAAADEVRTETGLMMMGVGRGGRHEDRLLTELKALLPDPPDARHVFQAIKSGVDHFVTTDERTILVHATELERFGIKAVLPSALLAKLT